MFRIIDKENWDYDLEFDKIYYSSKPFTKKTTLKKLELFKKHLPEIFLDEWENSDNYDDGGHLESMIINSIEHDCDDKLADGTFNDSWRFSFWCEISENFCYFSVRIRSSKTIEKVLKKLNRAAS